MPQKIRSLSRSRFIRELAGGYLIIVAFVALGLAAEWALSR